MKVFLILGFFVSCCYADFTPATRPVSLHEKLGQPIDYTLPWAWPLAPTYLEYYFTEEFKKIMPEVENLTEADRLISSPWLSQLDFSGVSKGVRKATAIHERLVVMAYHFRKSIGDTITWIDSNGQTVNRTLVGVRHWVSNDQTVGILDTPLPNTIKTYKMLPYGIRWLELRPAWLLVLDQEDKALGYSYKSGWMGWTAGFLYENGMAYTNELDNSENYPPAILHEPLVNGDSGAPSFFISDGDLILMSTHYGVNGNLANGPHITPTPWLLNSALDLLEEHLIPIQPDHSIEEEGINFTFENKGLYYQHVLKTSNDMKIWVDILEINDSISNPINVFVPTTQQRQFFELQTSIHRR